MGMFFFAAFAIAWLITLPPVLAKAGVPGMGAVPAGAGILIGVAPTVAAAIVVRRGKGFWRAAFRLPPLWPAAFGVLLPPTLLAVCYGVSALRGHPIKLSLGPETAVFAVLWLVLAFTEEVGWRGFALPRLAERFGFWAGSLILGGAWCVWHYPKLFGSPYLGSFAEAAPLVATFSVQIVVANFILCWLYVRSGGSVIAPTLYHASTNVVATVYFLAAADLVFTALLAAVVALIALLDRPSARRRVAAPAVPREALA
jgi:hypothetical protein